MVSTGAGVGAVVDRGEGEETIILLMVCCSSFGGKCGELKVTVK
jgi:hypothetical protein